MSRSKTTLFELRSGAIDAVHLVVKTPDFAALTEALQQRFDAARQRRDLLFFHAQAHQPIPLGGLHEKHALAGLADCAHGDARDRVEIVTVV